MRVSPAACVSCAVIGSSGRFETPLPLHGKLLLDLVQPPLNRMSGLESCQCDTVVSGWMSNASTTIAFEEACTSWRPVTVIVSMCCPGERS